MSTADFVQEVPIEPRRALLRRTEPDETVDPDAEPVPVGPSFDQFNAPEMTGVAERYARDMYVRALGATAAEDRPLARQPREVYPLTAPGMPLPGPDLVRLARARGATVEFTGKGNKMRLTNSDEVLEDTFADLLYSAGNIHVGISIGQEQVKRLAVVTGHRWAAPSVTGPIPTDVMVIGKMLGEEEKNVGRNLVGPTGELLSEKCELLRLEGYEDWYVTNLLKTEHPRAETGDSTLKVAWVKEFLPLLHQELRIVRPSYILCCGADALKALMGKRATLDGMMGRVVEFTYPVGRDDTDETVHTALLMACHHPAHILRTPELETVLDNELARFGQLIRGFRPDLPETDIDHRVIESLAELKALAKEIDRDCVRNTIAIDAEWNADHPENEGAYVRTIQLSWAPKKAVTIHVTRPGGKWCFKGHKKDLCKWIKKICTGRRLAGQFLTADMEWLLWLGCDLREEFTVPDSWDAYRENQLSDKPTGGFDIGLALHSFDETADFSLTAQTLRFTSAHRYDLWLDEWKKKYCADHKLKPKELEGYGECPEQILDPYGCFDVDIVSRLVHLYEQLLDADRFGNCSWEPFWISMRATPAVIEMQTTGVLINRKRVDDQTQLFMQKRDELEQEIRDWAKWPDLNLQSTQQVRELLFGEALNGKQRKDPAVPIRIRPRGARTMRVTPAMSSDKRPVAWAEVLRKGEQDTRTPSTNKTSLAMLSQDNTAVERHTIDGRTVTVDYSKVIAKLRDYRFIGQVLKSSLRDPDTDEETGGFILEDGFQVYSGGLPSKICGDGRIRTKISQTKETGRWSSWNPPLQNLAGKREADYQRILGALYKWPIRSIIVATPGYLLVEADFAGAELLGMATMSGDPVMIEHAMRASLPENHPNYYDIHSNITVLAFRLTCPPTKSGLKAIGKGHLRVVAKAIIFGLAYGRGAKAIALALREEGVDVSIEDAQLIIDTVLRMYPGLSPFFAACCERAIKERWLCGCFGRYRRFSRARDRRSEGDIERQAMNFPIQGMVGDAASRAADYLYHYRETHPLVDYRILLQIHDAFLLEVPYGHVGVVMNEVLPHCMSECVPIWPSDLAGTPNGTGPYRMGVDVKCCTSWGSTMQPDEYLSRKLDPALGHYEPSQYGWTHASKPKMIWVGDAAGGQWQTAA
jgi:uracil-DNA glycosylase family 4